MVAGKPSVVDLSVIEHDTILSLHSANKKRKLPKLKQLIQIQELRQATALNNSLFGDTIGTATESSLT